MQQQKTAGRRTAGADVAVTGDIRQVLDHHCNVASYHGEIDILSPGVDHFFQGGISIPLTIGWQSASGSKLFSWCIALCWPVVV